MPSSAESEQPQSELDQPADTNEVLTSPSDTDAVRAAEAGDDSAAAPIPPHFTTGADEEIFPLADAGEYYVGLWHGHPKYGCPVCAFTALADRAGDGDFAVDSHIQQKVDQGSEKHIKLLEGKGK